MIVEMLDLKRNKSFTNSSYITWGGEHILQNKHSFIYRKNQKETKMIIEYIFELSSSYRKIINHSVGEN